MSEKKLEQALTLPIQWESVTFPKSRANCPRIVVYGTQEMMDKDARDVLRHLCDDDAVGHMAYFPNTQSMQNYKVPTENATVERGAKTQSQRLRAVLFVRWRQLNEPSGDFETWYRQEMDYIISEYKAMLEPNE